MKSGGRWLFSTGLGKTEGWEYEKRMGVPPYNSVVLKYCQIFSVGKA